MISRIGGFLTYDLWHRRIRGLPTPKFVLFRYLRICVLAIRSFGDDSCGLRASALTFFTLLSIVPVLAMAFGIAQGFGFESALESRIRSAFAGQEQVMDRVIEFSAAMLSHTRGGVVAGTGVLVLLWSVIRVFGNIESSLNEIWGVQKGRPLGRKLVDYVAAMLVCPVLLLVSTGVMVYVTAQADHLAQQLEVWGTVADLVVGASRLLSLGVTVLLFGFLYRFMPNTKVEPRAAVAGAVIASLLYTGLQWVYVDLQVGVSNANAVYGSFAALPLFLLWLQLSWMIILFGAEVSFAYTNEETFEFEHDWKNASHRFLDVIAVGFVSEIAKRFVESREPLSASDLCAMHGLPIRLVRSVIHRLVEAGILVQIQTEDDREEIYHPGRPVADLTIAEVLIALETSGVDPRELLETADAVELSERIGELRAAMRNAPQNRPVAEL